MDPVIAFYQQLAATSFTLLGLWFGITTIAHGGWHDDPVRQRPALHIALHFLLPGMAGLGSVLAGGPEGSLIWRVTFVLAGMVGLYESITFFRAPGRPRAGRTLLLLDPPLYTAMIGFSFLQHKLRVPPLTPLQLEGMATGTLFLLGLVYVWRAFAERENDAPDAASKTHLGL